MVRLKGNNSLNLAKEEQHFTNSLPSTLSCELETELEAILNRSPVLTLPPEKEQEGDCVVDDRSLLRVKELKKRFESLDLFSEG